MGQAFFPEARLPEGGGVGVSAGVGDGLSSAAGLGDGLGFLRFDLLFGVGLGEGVGEAFFCFGEVSGAGVGVAFFLRCLRVGVGDGTKTFLIFVPSDSSAGRAASMAPNKITRIRSHFITRCCSVNCPQRRIESSQLVGCAEDQPSQRLRLGRQRTLQPGK